MQSLKTLTLPQSISAIDETAFNNCKKLTVKGYADSYAASYAAEHEIPFTAIGGETPDTTPAVTTTTTAQTTTTTKNTTTTAKTTTSAQTTTTTTAKKPAAVTKYGDADVSGGVDVSDAVLVARYLVMDRNAKFSDTGLVNSDVDGDGNVSSADMSLILNRIARIITEFPAEKK